MGNIDAKEYNRIYWYKCSLVSSVGESKELFSCKFNHAYLPKVTVCLWSQPFFAVNFKLLTKDFGNDFAMGYPYGISYSLPLTGPYF